METRVAKRNIKKGKVEESDDDKRIEGLTFDGDKH